PSAGRATQLTWFSRSGKPLNEVGQPGTFVDFSLAPDKKRLALADSTDRDLYLLDVATSGLTRFTYDAPSDRFPVWSPDGSRIVYARSLANLYEKKLGGTGERELTGLLGIPTDWSRDGHSILIRSNDGDLWTVTDDKPIRITQTQYTESHGQFS